MHCALTLDNLCWCGFHWLRWPCPWKMAIVLGCFEYGEGMMEWIRIHIACKMGGWIIFRPSFESTCENVKNNSYCILEAGVSNSKYLVIVFPDHWNLSPMCVEVRPVTQVYRKMASCSSKVTFFELLCPILRSVMTNSLNTGSSTPSSVQMRLGWPWSSSWAQASPDNMDVW